MKIPYSYIIIGILLLIILVMRMCQPTPQEPEPRIIIKTDTTWLKGKDSIVYKLGPVRVIPGDTIYKDVDTTAILKDYFSKIIYKDTLKIDTLGHIIVTDTISQNRIQNRQTILDYKIPLIKETITIYEPYKPKNQLYIGFTAIGSPTVPINYIGPDLTLKTKGDKLYNIGVGFSPNGGINYKIGLGWKIQLKK
jgi:hypothetical protein